MKPLSKLILLLVFVPLFGLWATASAQPTQVQCDGRVYMSIGGSSSPYTTVGLTYLDASQNTFPVTLIDPAGAGSGVNYNSIGINLLDGYMYGGTGRNIYRVGGNGQLQLVASNLVEDDGAGFINVGYRGDVDENGFLYAASGGNFLHIVDLANPTEWTKLQIKNTSGNNTNLGGADFAFSPITNDIFVKDNSGTRLGIIDVPDNISSMIGNGPINATITFTDPGTGPTGGAGGSWFDAKGNFYNFFNNKDGFGQIWKYTVDYSTSPASITKVEVLNGSANAMSRNDGASCAYTPLFEKDVNLRNLTAGQVAEYTFTLANARFDSLNDLTIFDNSMTSAAPGGDWGSIKTCTAVDLLTGAAKTPNPCPAILDQTASGTDKALDLRNIDMPSKTRLTITVDFQSPSTISGQVCNQATLGNLPSIHGNSMLSDDPDSPQGPDATCNEFGNPPIINCTVLPVMANYTPGTNSTFGLVLQNTGSGSAMGISLSDFYAPPTGAQGNGQLRCSTASNCDTISNFAGFANSNCTPATVADSDDYSSSNIALAGGTAAAPTKYCVAVPVQFNSSMTANYNIDPVYSFAGSNTACAQSTSNVNLQSDLRVTKTDLTSTFTPGSTQSYTVTFFNAGPSDVTGAQVVDRLASTEVTVSNLNTSCSCTSGNTSTCTNSLNPAVSTTGGTTQITDTVNIPSQCTATLTYDLTTNQ